MRTRIAQNNSVRRCSEEACHRNAFFASSTDCSGSNFHIFADEEQRAIALLRNSGERRRGLVPAAKTLSMAKRALTTPGHLYTSHLCVLDCMHTRHTHARVHISYVARPTPSKKGHLCIALPSHVGHIQWHISVVGTQINPRDTPARNSQASWDFI